MPTVKGDNVMSSKLIPCKKNPNVGLVPRNALWFFGTSIVTSGNL